MNRSFLRREWGAVTFVLTVLLGAIVVPLAFVLGNHGSSGAPTGAITAPSASAARAASPSPAASASPVASPSPTH